MKPCALFLFNSSHYAVAPWLNHGYHCVTVDYHETDHSGDHRPTYTHSLLTRVNLDLSQEAAGERLRAHLCALGLTPALVVSFAPCTNLAVSGAKHFKRKLEADPECQTKAITMAKLASTFGVPYAVENPVSVLATLWRAPDHYWHPWEYAGYCPEGPHPEAPTLYPPQDRYNKKSCLWAGHGFIMPPKAPLEPEVHENPGFLALGGKGARTKHLRSLTPRGFAQAVFESNHCHLDRALGALWRKPR